MPFDQAGAVPFVGAGLPAMQALRCRAPALPVIAGKPAPTGLASAVDIEYVSATEGGETAWVPFDQAGAVPFVGAGLPAMQALRCRAPALPVIAGKPAPTGLASAVDIEYVSATEGGETAWMPFDQAGAVPFVAAGLPVMQALRCRAPAVPVIAGKPAPTGLASAVDIEYVSATEGGGTAWMPFDQAGAVPFVGAGLPAMQALRCRAPAVPVIAGKPAPTGLASAVDIEYVSATESGETAWMPFDQAGSYRRGVC